MMRCVGGVVCVAMAALGLAAVMCHTLRAQDQRKSGPPPLKVDKSAPLLLDEPKEKPKPPTDPSKKMADNAPCYVCHENFREEPFVKEHAKDGCVACHGDSPRHMEDEGHLTPPDLMFWPEVIEPRCRVCHRTHNAPAVKVIAQWQKLCPNKTDPKSLLCTDCHGTEHRLKDRTVRWDKKTGKVLERKVVADKEKTCASDAPQEDM
ncbi:MAG: hypothetical protein AB1696_15985 [Planctomycetota bacterium]